MRNLVPRFILERFQAGTTRGSFPAVGMFVDISGFSQITDDLMVHGQHGAEVLADAMRNIFSPLVKFTYEQGGFISTLAGDAFTAIFPIRGDDENTCLRALSAAWQIRQEFPHLAQQVTPYGEFSISGKIGIAIGDATWGIVSSNDGARAAYFVTGSAVEQSAIAEGNADPGQILVTPQFHSMIANCGEFTPREDHFTVSGIHISPNPPMSFDRSPIDSNLAARFYPQSLFEQAHSGEFRQVVTMFINLPTVRTEDQLNIFIGSLFELQDKYGGLLTRLDFGDKGSNLLLFWGAPVSFENDIERALNLILELQTQTSIPINAGITYQIAHAGFIGSHLREEYSTYGRGVNLAARFMTAAQRGEIWVDEEIARKAGDKFEILPDGEYSFKGFAQKQPVYLLEERKETIETFYQTDLVGRQDEINQLNEFIAPLTENKYCGGLIILGDAGIGKTRLVNEFSDQVDTKIQWAICQCDQAIREPFHPLSYWLRQYFSISSFQNESRNKRNFNRKIDRVISSLNDDILAAELDRTRSFIGALVDLYWPDSLHEQVDPQGRYDNSIIGVISLIQAACSSQPLILQVEDAQWLDEDSWNLLIQLDRTIKSSSSDNFTLAIIVTARLEFLSLQYTADIAFKELRIGELSEAALKKIADQILEGPISMQLFEQLRDRADGNPFFAEQIAHYLLDEEKVRNEDGEWVLSEPSQSPLPDNIRALLVSRIDRLTQDVKEVVLTASVLGREFEIQLLSHMLDGDINLEAKITAAEQHAIWSKISELRYLFSHALLLDAAYRMQVHSRRQALHKSAVQAIENLYGEELTNYSTDLAYHCELAGLVEKARYYLLEGAESAKNDYLNTQSIDLYSRAIKLTPEENYQSRCDILFERLELLSFLGRHEEQLSDLRQLDLLIKTEGNNFSPQEKAGYLSKIANGWADYKIETGDFQGAIDSVQEIIFISENEDLPENLVNAYFFWAVSLFRQGNFDDAANQGRKGLSLANASGDLEGEIRILNLLGLVALEMDDPDQAKKNFTRSLDLAKKNGNLRAQAQALNNLGNEALSYGDFDSAHEYYLQSIELVRKIGDLPSESLVLNNLGFIAGNYGDYSSARVFYEHSLRSAHQVGNRIQEAFSLINSSSVYRALKEYDEALSNANRGLTITKDVGERNWEAWALTSLGKTYFELGKLRKSANAFKEAIDLRQAMEQNNLVCEPYAGLARISLQTGDLSAALMYVDRIIDYLDQDGSLEGTEEPIRIYLTCFQVLRKADDPRAKKIIEAGYQLLQDRAAGIDKENLRNIFYENIPQNRELLNEWQALKN